MLKYAWGDTMTATERVQTNLSIRTDKDIKMKAEYIFENLGLNMSTAVNIFLRQVIREGGIPFELKIDIPNEETLAAIEEGNKLLNDPNAVGYCSMEELSNALEI